MTWQMVGLIIIGKNMDVRRWRSEEYRSSVVAERLFDTRIVFSIVFVPNSSPAPEHVVTANSDGSISLHSISRSHQADGVDVPLLSLPYHEGPAYGLVSFGEDYNRMLASCGDDGRIGIWRWQDIFNAVDNSTEDSPQPILELKNPQQRGHHGSLLPIPETNALAVDVEVGCIFAATGDGSAYAWDLETGQSYQTYQGHKDYLHCIASRPSHKQGLKMGLAGYGIDCRSGRCTSVLDPWNAVRVQRRSKESRLPWASCVAIDATGNWMVCGSGGKCLTLWNLPMLVSATRIATAGIPQAVTFTKDEIVVAGAQPHISRFNFGGKVVSQVACAPLSSFCVSVDASSGVTAVGGHGGMVDIISDFGSHLSTFRS